MKHFLSVAIAAFLLLGSANATQTDYFPPGTLDDRIGNAHHAPNENRSTKSADGRMATEAAWLERKETEKNILVEKKREKHP